KALAPGTTVRHRPRPGVQRLARRGRGPPWAVARADGIVRPAAGRARAALFRGPDRGRHRSRPRLLAGRREDACCAWSRSASQVDIGGGLDAMNDLEDLLREELHARVAAAEASQAEESATVLLGRLDQRIRRARLRQRWGAAGLSAIGIGVAIFLPLALLAPGAPAGYGGNGAHHLGIPLSDTAATPSDWAPIAYGHAQISVPPDW